MGAILYLVSVPAAQIFILTGISEPCLPVTAFCEETSTVTPDFLILFIYLFIFCLVLSVFFFQVFSKNSLIKNIFEEEKRLIVEHDFFFGK